MEGKENGKNAPFSQAGEGKSEYMGNFFGWKFSIAGMVITAVLFAYLLLAGGNGDTPSPGDQPPTTQDSLKGKSE